MPAARPISVRLQPEVDAPVRNLARRTRRPLGRVINELLDHALRMQRFPGIVFANGPAGPRARLVGTGLDVWELVSLVRAYDSTDALLKAFPALAQSHIDTALAYTAAYPEEIEGAIAENERPMEEVMRESPLIKKFVV
ncbi:MAG: DUF433 domain-containing protein [Chloroflexota bacterium]